MIVTFIPTSISTISGIETCRVEPSSSITTVGSVSVTSVTVPCRFSMRRVYALRREWNGSRSDERLPKPRDHHEVGVLADTFVA